MKQGRPIGKRGQELEAAIKPLEVDGTTIIKGEGIEIDDHIRFTQRIRTAAQRLGYTVSVKFDKQDECIVKRKS